MNHYYRYKAIYLILFIIILLGLKGDSAEAGKKKFDPWLKLNFETCTVDEVKALVDKGASIDAKDEKLNSPLHHFASEARFEHIKYLVELGANINHYNHEGYTPLICAIRAAGSNVYDPNKSTIKYGGFDEEGSLLLREIVRYLISAGAEVNIDGEIYVTIKKGLKASKVEPLYAAVGINDTGCARILLEAGARVDSDRELSTLLNKHCKNTLTLVKLLAESGADINDPIYLHIAARMGNVDVVRYLITLGCDVNADGGTSESVSCASPISYAVRGYCGWRLGCNSHLEILDMLKAAGADFDIQYKTDGTRPLDVAIYHRCIKGVVALLERGADPNIGNYLYKIADFEVRKSNMEKIDKMEIDAKIAEALIAAGADVHLEPYPGNLLEIASKRDNKPVAMVLLNAGAKGKYIGMEEPDWDWDPNATRLLIGLGIKIGMSRESVATAMKFAKPDVIGHGTKRITTVTADGQPSIPTKMVQTESWVYWSNDEHIPHRFIEFEDGVVVRDEFFYGNISDIPD